MWKVIIADDEKIILNGLKKLIKWEELDAEIVGEAGTGTELLELIKERKPDLVVSDIKMPGATGLEVIAELEGGEVLPKFIFISAYQEFAFAKEAMNRGAVDYLLKPVGRKDLENSVKKAFGQIKTETTAGVFREEENPLQQLFATLNEGKSYGRDDMYKIFTDMNIQWEGMKFVGLTFGIIERQNSDFAKFSAEKKHLTRFSALKDIGDRMRDSGKGFCISMKENKIHLIGLCDEEDELVFVESTVIPFKSAIENKYNIRMCAGVGKAADDVMDLYESYRTSDVAYKTYFNEERAIIFYPSLQIKDKEEMLDVRAAADDVFASIVTKDGQFMKKISEVVEEIGRIHYGNPGATKNRVMSFTGDVAMRIHRYSMIDWDFYQMQDELQKNVESVYTFMELKECVMQHYERLLPEIYRTVRTKDRMQIEDVKNYIKANYNKEMSVKELSEVACVSPNYFSALFKKETGENYKTYLTHIRMDEALKLIINTDMKSYEISEKVGYNNVRRFVDAFRDIYGVSPAEYRRKSRGE